MEYVGIVRAIENNLQKEISLEFLLLQDSLAFTGQGEFLFNNKQYVSDDYNYLSCLSYSCTLRYFNLRAINDSMRIYRIV